MILADASSAIPSWGIQLGIALPFILALGFIGKWLVNRLDRVENEKEALYGRLISDVVPALKSSTDLAEEMLTTQRALAADRATMVAMMQDLKQQQTEANRQQAEIMARYDELRRAEIDASRRGGR